MSDVSAPPKHTCPNEKSCPRKSFSARTCIYSWASLFAGFARGAPARRSASSSDGADGPGRGAHRPDVCGNDFRFLVVGVCASCLRQRVGFEQRCAHRHRSAADLGRRRRQSDCRHCLCCWRATLQLGHLLRAFFAGLLAPRRESTASCRRRPALPRT